MTRFALLLLALLGGCGLFPLSEADCKAADWRARGYEHGYLGQSRQDMRLIPECRQRYGLEIQRSEYLAGWADGHNEWDRVMGSMMRRGP